MRTLKRIAIAGITFMLIVMLTAPLIPDEPGAAEEQGNEIGRAFADWVFSPIGLIVIAVGILSLVWWVKQSTRRMRRVLMQIEADEREQDRYQERDAVRRRVKLTRSRQEERAVQRRARAGHVNGDKR